MKPNYSKILFVTDGGINIRPNKDVKKEIVDNAIYLAHVFKIKKPKVALLAAIETLNPKVEETIEWAEIAEEAKDGSLGNAFIDGPLALDLAVSKKSVLCKKFVSDVAGDADILVAPDLNSGNILLKALNYLGRGFMAGLVVGAKIPIILTSRATSAEERAMSCKAARCYSYYMKNHGEICGK